MLLREPSPFIRWLMSLFSVPAILRNEAPAPRVQPPRQRYSRLEIPALAAKPHRWCCGGSVSSFALTSAGDVGHDVRRKVVAVDRGNDQPGHHQVQDSDDDEERSDSLHLEPRRSNQRVLVGCEFVLEAWERPFESGTKRAGDRTRPGRAETAGSRRSNEANSAAGSFSVGEFVRQRRRDEILATPIGTRRGGS